jgi:hypothetical protein
MLIKYKIEENSQRKNQYQHKEYQQNKWTKYAGAPLKKLRRAEGGANIFGVFRVKNHDLPYFVHLFCWYSLCWYWFLR